MVSDTKMLYDDVLFELIKATGGNSVPSNYIRNLNSIQQASEPKVLKAFTKILRKARVRFVKLFPKIELGMVKDEESDAIKAQLLKMMKSIFTPDMSDELVASLQDQVDSIAHNFESALDVELNYKVINDNAVQYLQESAENLFTTLTDSQAAGVAADIAEAMQGKGTTEEGLYTIRDIAKNVADNFLKNDMYFPDRKLDLTDYSLLVARTESARATSAATQATLESLNLQKWEWNA